MLYLALFGPLLEKVVQATPDLPPGDAWQIFVPGLMVQLGLFGTAFVGFGLIAEYRAGVIERMRVTPAHRLALLLGRVARGRGGDPGPGRVLTVAAVPFGLRAPVGGRGGGAGDRGPAGGGLVVAVVHRGAASPRARTPWPRCSTGWRVPVLLLSGILLPMTLAPRWLRTLSDANPFKHVVDAVRALFQGNATGARWAGGWCRWWAW